MKVETEGIQLFGVAHCVDSKVQPCFIVHWKAKVLFKRMHIQCVDMLHL